jgi:arginase
MSKNIVFVINKSEITAGTRGASLGPEAIKTAARKKGSTIFQNAQFENIEDKNFLLDSNTNYPFGKRIDGLLSVYNQLNLKIDSVLKQESFPLILAADHGSAGGTISGIKTAYPEKKLGVIWIDAHADIHTPFTTPSGNMHGMPLATSLNIDNKDCQINDVDEETVTYWEKLKNIGGINPKINPEDLIYIAVRDTEEQENFIVNKLGIQNISVDFINQFGSKATIEKALEHLKHCDVIYVSFDVDSMDPNLTSSGTGTPVPNGISPEIAKELLVGFTESPKTVCLEIVEVNPCLDEKGNTMAEVTLDILEAVITTIKQK